MFLIVDDPITLVDTGPKTEEAFHSLRDQVEAAGVRLEQIRRIIISHTHEDHAGLAARLKGISGATVYVHPWDAHRLTGERDYLVGRKMLAQVGVPVPVIDAFEVRWRQYRTLLDPLPDVQLLDEGDEVTFETGAFRVLHTPGHTPGHICLWREGEKVLIAADTVLKRITPNPVINLDPRDSNRRFPSLSMYLRTLERLRDLAPTLIHTGHGEQVLDLGAYYHHMLRHVRARQERLLSLFPPQAVTAWDMSLKLFSHIGDDQQFLAVSETSAHLDLAVSERKLSRQDRDGIEFHRLTSQ